jgi:starvation-inducible DNA-binding protein
MHSTRNDLERSARKRIVELLNARLADAIDLALQAKQAHWNVKGPQFIALHELFDKVHGVAMGHVDLIAERAVTLGGKVDGTIVTVAKRTTLRAYPKDLSDGRDHVKALADALAATVKPMRAAIDATVKIGDAATADLFTEIARDLDMQLWFVEAHVQADR